MLYENFSKLNETHKVKILEVFNDKFGNPSIRYEFKGNQGTSTLNYLLSSIKDDKDFVYVANLSVLKPWFDKQESQQSMRKGKTLTKQRIVEAVSEAFPNTFAIKGDILSRYVSGGGSDDRYCVNYDCYSFDIISQNKVRVKNWTYTRTDEGDYDSDENTIDIDEKDVIPYIGQKMLS